MIMTGNYQMKGIVASLKVPRSQKQDNHTETICEQRHLEKKQNYTGQLCKEDDLLALRRRIPRKKWYYLIEIQY